MRELVAQRLSLPTQRVDQWIRFDVLPEVAARELKIENGQPGFIMEMRGYTLRNRPLYYQSVYSGPFAERLIILREHE